MYYAKFYKHIALIIPQDVKVTKYIFITKIIHKLEGCCAIYASYKYVFYFASSYNSFKIIHAL